MVPDYRAAFHDCQLVKGRRELRLDRREHPAFHLVFPLWPDFKDIVLGQGDHKGLVLIGGVSDALPLCRYLYMMAEPKIELIIL